MDESKRPLGITDVVLRDAHQSLFATRLRLDDMLPIAAKLDEVGFWSLESWGGATFDACIRYLGEDPWERIRELKKAMPKTPQQMLFRGQNILGYRHYADDVVEKFVERAAHNGVDVFRVFDAMNDMRNLEVALQAVKAVGKHAQGTISYTLSPVHNIETWVEMGKRIEDTGADSIAIKDMAGLLHPYAGFELVTRLKASCDIPIHMQCHATTGLSTATILKCVEAGIDNVDTSISSMSMTYGHSPTESVVAILQDTDRDTGLDIGKLAEIAAYFREVRKKYAKFEGSLRGVDARILVAQVPGGMLTNMESQLREQGAADKMDQVLEEIPRVREDLGFIPLVTPTSQIVGTQAVLNVLTGKRYETITNEVKLYLQGRYGKAPSAIDPGVQRQAIGSQDIIDQRPADLIDDELDKLRTTIGDLAGSEEDVLTFAMFPEIGREFLEQRNSGTLVPEPLEQVSSGGNGDQARPSEFNVTLHGESYHIKVTGTGHRTQDNRPFYLTVDGIPEEVLVETLDEIFPSAQPEQGERGMKGSRRPRATLPGHVTTSMPGTIIDVLVSVGDQVDAGAPVLITEAMKMETEIQAPVAGTVSAIHVEKGDTVNPDETLVEIE